MPQIIANTIGANVVTSPESIFQCHYRRWSEKVSSLIQQCRAKDKDEESPSDLPSLPTDLSHLFGDFTVFMANHYFALLADTVLQKLQRRFPENCESFKLNRLDLGWPRCIAKFRPLQCTPGSWSPPTEAFSEEQCALRIERPLKLLGSAIAAHSFKASCESENSPPYILPILESLELYFL